MRIWSIHPKYLDSKGLVALWRETLLAKNVLENKTKGYKNHPQLERFKDSAKPLESINFYLKHVWIEACARNYSFNKEKFSEVSTIQKIDVTTGQMAYEKEHLFNKLMQRDPVKYHEINTLPELEPHPLFNLIQGDISPWEKT